MPGSTAQEGETGSSISPGFPPLPLGRPLTCQGVGLSKGTVRLPATSMCLVARLQWLLLGQQELPLDRIGE